MSTLILTKEQKLKRQDTFNKHKLFILDLMYNQKMVDLKANIEDLNTIKIKYVL